jgi:hypothetical protein
MDTRYHADSNQWWLPHRYINPLDGHGAGRKASNQQPAFVSRSGRSAMLAYQ